MDFNDTRFLLVLVSVAAVFGLYSIGAFDNTFDNIDLTGFASYESNVALSEIEGYASYGGFEGDGITGFALKERKARCSKTSECKRGLVCRRYYMKNDKTSWVKSIKRYCNSPMPNGGICVLHDQCRQGSLCMRGRCTAVPPISSGNRPCDRENQVEHDSGYMYYCKMVNNQLVWRRNIGNNCDNDNQCFPDAACQNRRCAGAAQQAPAEQQQAPQQQPQQQRQQQAPPGAPQEGDSCTAEQTFSVDRTENCRSLTCQIAGVDNYRWQWVGEACGGQDQQQQGGADACTVNEWFQPRPGGATECRNGMEWKEICTNVRGNIYVYEWQNQFVACGQQEAPAQQQAPAQQGGQQQGGQQQGGQGECVIDSNCGVGRVCRFGQCYTQCQINENCQQSFVCVFGACQIDSDRDGYADSSETVEGSNLNNPSSTPQDPCGPRTQRQNGQCACEIYQYDCNNDMSYDNPGDGCELDRTPGRSQAVGIGGAEGQEGNPCR